MNVDAYETAAGRLFNVKELQKQVKMATAMGQYISALKTCPYSPTVPATQDIVAVTPGSHCDVFRHPLFTGNTNNSNRSSTRVITKREVAVDIRGLVRANMTTDGQWTPSSGSDFMFAVGRGFLTAIMANEQPTLLMTFSQAPAAIFSKWLTDRINSQLHLEIEDQLKIRACAAWFYVGMFADEISFKQDYDRFLGAAQRAAQMDTKQWKDVMGGDSLDWVATIDDFCGMVRSKAESSLRLEGLNRRFVTEVTVGSFRGAQGREYVAVGLEHPPTFIAMVQLCAKESSFYKKMPLGDAVDRFLRRPSDKDDFLVAVSRLPF